MMATGSWAILPAGMLAAGFLLEAIGLRATLGTIALGFAALSIGVLLTPALRQMDTPPLDVREAAESAMVQLDKPK